MKAPQIATTLMELFTKAGFKPKIEKRILSLVEKEANRLLFFDIKKGWMSMATIQTSIAISDGTTPQFQKMAQAAEITTGRFERAAAAASKVETAISNNGVREVNAIASAAEGLAPSFGAATSAVNGLGNRLVDVSGRLSNMRILIEGMGGALKGALAITGIATIVSIIVSLLSSLAGKLSSLSDQYSGIMARIRLITSGEQEAAELNDQIYYSALRARGGYKEMADTVSKLGLTAHAAFQNPQEIVPFVENIQKLFAIGGTGVQQQADALLQLTQSMGSGRLQGDEFRSIAEAAPMIEQVVAKYMGVTQGELKQLSSDGQITAEIMRNAILGATDDINQKFKSIPLTWENIWQNAKTVAFKAFVPVFDQISALANSPVMQSFGSAVAIGASMAGTALAGVINNLRWVGGVAAEVGTYIGGWISAGFTIAAQGTSVALGIVAMALIVATGVALGLAVGWTILNAEMLYHTAVSALITAYTWGEVGVIWAAHAAVSAYRWIIFAIVGAKMMWTVATNGATVAQMLLAGAIWLVSTPLLTVAAIIVGAMVAALAIWGLASINLRDVFAGAMDFMIDACQNGVNTMVGMINGLIDVVNKAANGLNSLFGTHIGTVEHVSTVNFQGAKRWSGYVRDGTFKEHLISEIGGMFSLPQIPQAPNMPLIPNIPEIGDIDKNGKDTADNTKKIKEALDITDEDIKYLRDVAEQEVINKYTTAEVKIDMGGITNTINSDMDLDGMIRYINDRLFEAMAAGAEKVHP